MRAKSIIKVKAMDITTATTRVINRAHIVDISAVSIMGISIAIITAKNAIIANISAIIESIIEAIMVGIMDIKVDIMAGITDIIVVALGKPVRPYLVLV